MPFGFHVRRLQHLADMSPHKPVEIKVKGDFRRYSKIIMRQPQPIDVELPVGCAREPPTWPHMPATIVSQDQSTSLWCQIARCAETECLGRRDLVGANAPAAKGRELPPRFVRVPVLPPRARNQPKASAEARTWRWIARKTAALWCTTYRVVWLFGDAGTG